MIIINNNSSQSAIKKFSAIVGLKMKLISSSLETKTGILKYLLLLRDRLLKPLLGIMELMPKLELTLTLFLSKPLPV